MPAARQAASMGPKGTSELATIGGDTSTAEQNASQPLPQATRLNGPSPCGPTPGPTSTVTVASPSDLTGSTPTSPPPTDFPNSSKLSRRLLCWASGRIQLPG